MKKCKGCGVTLQNEDPKKVGFITDLEKDYCQRCFRLSHYGDITTLHNKSITNNDIAAIYENYRSELFALVIDVFDAFVLAEDGLLDMFRDKKLLLIINKTDLLPSNVTENKINDIFGRIIKKAVTKGFDICGVLLTNKADPSLRDFFMEEIADTGAKRIVFAGRANAGKSTIINTLLGNDDLTISRYPGTTLDANEIECDGFTFIDTPGIFDEENIVTKIPNSQIDKIIYNKTIRPRVYQFYEDQSYFFDGLLDIDVKPYKNASITFFLNSMLDVHRTKLSNRDNYYERNRRTFVVKDAKFKDNRFEVRDEMFFCIKGIGFVKVNGRARINIRCDEKIKIYKCEEKI